MEETKEKFEMVQAPLKIANAINIMSSLVSSTMGPNGGTVIVPSSTEYGKYNITKDGVTVAKHVKSSDPFEQVVIDLMKEVAENTVKIAGDGTTTSIVLTKYFLKYLSQMPINSDNFKIYQECLNNTLSILDRSSERLRNEDIYKIAMVSSNGDEVIAKNITEAYSKSKTVHIDKSKFDTDNIEFNDGLLIPSKPIESYNFKFNKDFSDKTIVLVIDRNINDIKLLTSTLDHSIKTQTTVLVVCNHVDESVLNIVNLNNKANKTNVMFVKSPGFSSHRTNLLSDIAAYCNCELVTDTTQTITKDNIGSIDSFEVFKDKTIIKNNTDNVVSLLEELRIKLSKTEEDYDKDLINQRIDRLSGIVQIKVGGKSENELNERFDRYEDAVLAVKCAIEEGIIEGGGLALLRIAHDKLNDLGFNGKYTEDPRVSFYLSLVGPFETIVANGAKINPEDNLKDKDIYDPVKVTKTALEQSFNFVKLLLTNKAIILTNENAFN